MMSLTCLLALSTWRDVAVVLLMIEMLLIGIVYLAVFAALAYGLFWAKGKLKNILRRVQPISAKTESITVKGTDVVARNIITMHSTVVLVQETVRTLLASFRAPRQIATSTHPPTLEAPGSQGNTPA